MKIFSITSKAYVSINVPIDKDTTFVIPKKGNTVTISAEELPMGLKVLADKKIILVDEIK